MDTPSLPDSKAPDLSGLLSQTRQQREEDARRRRAELDSFLGAIDSSLFTPAQLKKHAYARRLENSARRRRANAEQHRRAELDSFLGVINKNIEQGDRVEDFDGILEQVDSERARRLHALTPDIWARERLGDELWSAQVEICRAVKKYRKVAVRSCHGAGKSRIASVVCGHWLDTNDPGDAFVVTSAPTGPQVRAILWREIGRVHARGNLLGRVNQTQWMMEITDPRTGQVREELVGFGRKPADYDPTAFQGIHAPKVLVVFDEACGIPEELWIAADSIAANDDSHLLAIGNPDDPQSYFAEICKPGSGWHVIEISAFMTPNFTGEELDEKIKKQLIGRLYVEERRQKWARNWTWTADGSACVPPPGVGDRDTHPYWQSKVLGRFPTIAEDPGLIPLHWITKAQERTLQTDGDRHLGVDVGGGGDSSCGCSRIGPVYRITWEDKNPDTMQTCGRAIEVLHAERLDRGKVDMIGIGRGVVDRAREQDEPFRGVNVGSAPYLVPLDYRPGPTDYEEDGVTLKQPENKRFVNLRAQGWWYVRHLFETGAIDIDPEDKDLEEELVSIRFKRTSQGRIQIESKQEAARRGVKSPNRADALMLAALPDIQDEENVLEGYATW